MDAQAFFSGLGEIMAVGHPDPATLNAGARWEVEFLGPTIAATSKFP